MRPQLLSGRAAQVVEATRRRYRRQVDLGRIVTNEAFTYTRSIPYSV